MGIDAPDLAGVLVIDPVVHPQGLGGDIVTGYDADIRPVHRGVADPHGEQRFDLDPHAAGGLFDTLERGIIGDTQAVDVFDLDSPLMQALFDLRPGAVHQYQPHAEAVEQGDVVYQGGELGVHEHLATETDHEGPLTKGIDVRRGVAKPAYVFRIVLIFIQAGPNRFSRKYENTIPFNGLCQGFDVSYYPGWV